jgi:penicillin-insensitive murein DD-endopeptidase
LFGAALGASVGCARLGVTSDGSSVSGGQPNRGWLLDGRRIADEGDGFVTHEQWRSRGLRFGTDELLDLLIHVARTIAPLTAPIRLGIADLSRLGGGPADPYHRSHQSGRDVDLLLYLIDETGRPYESSMMRALGDDGVAADGSKHRLDVPRTWQLIRALISAPERNVQYLFLYEPLSLLLLDHARSIDEPPWLVDLARIALLEPSGAPHNDHLHVRVFCSPHDVEGDCREFGNMQLRDKQLNGATIWASVHSQLLRQLPLAGPSLLAWRPDRNSLSANSAAAAEPFRTGVGSP